MKKVLIIEDDRYLTDLLAELLKTDEIECVVANSIDVVINDWGALGNYNVIILDIMMMRDGLEGDLRKEVETGEVLFKKIRDSFPKKQIIIISAKDVRLISIKFQNEPKVSFLQKPLGESDYLELLKIIRSA